MESLREYLLDRYTQQTTESYLYIINNFRLENTDAEKLTYSDIVRYLGFLVQRGLSEQTRVTNLSALKKYYDYLISIGARDDHPCRSISIRSKKKDVQTQNLFSTEELDLLFSRPNRYANLSIRNKAIISLLIYQGLSSEEIIRLNTTNVNFDNGTFFIKASKRYKARTLAFHRTQFSTFYEYINTARDNLIRIPTKSLFLTKVGKPMTVDGIHAMIEPLKGLFPGRDLSPLTIRQSVIANWLNERKLPLEDVQNMAGHRFPSATDRYKSINVEEKRKWVNQFHPLG
jgi:site-specific recombinase XerD